MVSSHHGQSIRQNEVAIDDVTTLTNELVVTATFSRENSGQIEGALVVEGGGNTVSEGFEFTDTERERVTTSFSFDFAEGGGATMTITGKMTRPEQLTADAVTTVSGPGVDGVAIVETDVDSDALTVTVQFDASDNVQIEGGVSVNPTHNADEDVLSPTTERLSLDPPHPSKTEVSFEWDLPPEAEIPVEISAYMTKPVARNDGADATVIGADRIDLGILEQFRQPQYTGENRCLPCTGLNIAIATVLAAILSFALFTYTNSMGGAGAGLLGIGFLLFSLGVIYLRGYLLPGTPQITKKYFPDWFLQWFDKDPETATNVGRVDIEETLTAADVLTECEHVDDLCLTDDFGKAWHNRIETVRTQNVPRGNLAAVLDINPNRLVIQDHGEAFEASIDDRHLGQWESRAAFLADVAAAKELEERYQPWTQIKLEEQGRILNNLRIFLEQCPTCDGPVLIDQEVVDSCCRSIDVVAMTCQECGARLLESERY